MSANERILRFTFFLLVFVPMMDFVLTCINHAIPLHDKPLVKDTILSLRLMGFLSPGTVFFSLFLVPSKVPGS